MSAVDAMRERLAAVNTMAAGLAHERNNAVAGAQRAAGELGVAIAAGQRFSALLVSGALERDAATSVRWSAMQRDGSRLA